VGMFAWMCWLGVAPGWAVFFVAFVFMVSLLVTRLAAETGLPFSQLNAAPQTFLYLVPISWLTPVTVWFAMQVSVFFGNASIANPAALATHALQLDEEATPKSRWRLSLILIVTMAIGMVICGGVHIYGSYRHSITMDGLERPLNPFFFGQFQWSINDVQAVMEEKALNVPDERPAHLVFGAVLASALEWAALSTPSWPLHPVGLLVLGSWYVRRAVASIFIGWLLKILILRYGGARLFRQVTPFFLGLIVGDVIALIFWGLAPAALILCGWQP